MYGYLLNEGFQNPNTLEANVQLNTDNRDASCLERTAETTSFNSYINKCRNSIDSSRADNFFSKTSAQYKDIFQGLRAQYDNLIISGDSQDTMASLSGNTHTVVSSQIGSLEKKREELIFEVKKTQNEAQSSDRMFLDDIMHQKDKKELYPTLQDFALGVFIFGWFLMICVLVFVRSVSPGGGLLAGFFTLLLLLIISLCLYGLLLYAA